MAAAKEYFIFDGKLGSLRIERTCTENPSGRQFTILTEVSFAFEAGVRFLRLYLPPETPNPPDVIAHFVRTADEVRSQLNGATMTSGHKDTDENISSADLPYSDRMLIYLDHDLGSDIRKQLIEMAKSQNIALVLRDGHYIQRRLDLEPPHAFISHDSRDKDDLARPLAEEMRKLMMNVWYDEFSLNPGDSLRASIDKGLKECKRCVLLLSPNFIKNKGWGKTEFDSIFTREIVEQTHVIIPIWHNVSRADVFEYSSNLPDRVAISSTVGIPEMARKIYNLIIPR